ncbi:MAG: nucleotide sugar dehydrogenase, partial [Candidatus Heimdallarchaeota archaeon]|nr:nucleotide sugar dehydrogenase [Candidatus Heimdallarchaeota archaeon]
MSKICILGLGYIGLPTALLFANNGHDVIGVDINPAVVESLNKGKAHFVEDEIPELLSKAIKLKTFKASTKVEDADIFIICVQTPLDKNYNIADLEYVKIACEMIVPNLKKGDMVIIESTISPGSTEMLFRKILEKSKLKAGIDFYIIHCPERAIPGKTIFEMINNHRVIGGFTEEGAKAAKKLYSSFVDSKKIYCTNLRTAEIVKIFENTYRDLNIAIANEFAMISE